MAIYYPKIRYRNRTNLDNDINLIVTSFEDESGQKDSFLSMQASYFEHSNGTRTDFGAKYNTVAQLSVTLIKPNNGVISVAETRNVLKWLTGAKNVSWLDLYKYDTDSYVIAYSFLGRFTDVKLQKNGSQVIGIVAFFEATSPWAYSGEITATKTLNSRDTATTASITCNSDDIDIDIFPQVVFTVANNGGSTASANPAVVDLRIENTTLNTGINSEDLKEKVILKNLSNNEVITMDTNQIIYSNNTSKKFLNTFNYTWLRLKAGTNNLSLKGIGSLTIKYRDIYKVADAIVDINDTYIHCS